MPAYLAEKGADDALKQLRKAEERVKAAPKGSAERAAAIAKRDRAGKGLRARQGARQVAGRGGRGAGTQVVNGTGADAERARGGPVTRRQLIDAQDSKEEKFRGKQETRGAAAAVATAGVGGVVCGLAVLGASVIGSQVGKEATKLVYDKALAPAGRALGDLAERYVPDAAKAVGDTLEDVDDGARKVAHAVNPTNWS